MPALFSNEEFADLHFVYDFRNGNAEDAVAEYRFAVVDILLLHTDAFREAGSDIIRHFGRNNPLNDVAERRTFRDVLDRSTRRVSRRLRIRM
jgi:hypothetical protein